MSFIIGTARITEMIASPGNRGGILAGIVFICGEMYSPDSHISIIIRICGSLRDS